MSMYPLLVKLLVRLALRKYPARVLGNRLVVQSVYMVRYYLFGGPDHLKPHALFRVYINNFRRSDDDTALHNHPWKWAVAIILINGYIEERLTPAGVIKRKIKPWRPWAPWRVNYISGKIFHRVELVDGQPSWSIFIIPGQSTQEWGFRDRTTGAFRPAKPKGYLDRQGN